MKNFLFKDVRRIGFLIILSVLTSATITSPHAGAAVITYKVGDRTPTGGTVFYVLPADTVSQWHYLEVAPDSWNSGKLVSTSYKKAESYVYAYADKSWYIPSSNEFATLYSANKAKLLKSINLKSGAYWTSTGVVTNKQIQSLQAFSTLTRKLTAHSYKSSNNGNVLLRVRPIRYFN
jgi:hypothetical protein